MLELLEPRIRKVVAECLGVDAEELRPEVSLSDDLAADSLDIIETLTALETDLGISIPERAIATIRTYRDLVDAAITLVQRRNESGGLLDRPPLFVRVRLVSCGTNDNGSFLCADWLTPYVAELIRERALRVGGAARLELTLPRGTTQHELAQVEKQFSALQDRGVDVRVSCQTAPGSGDNRPTPQERPPLRPQSQAGSSHP